MKFSNFKHCASLAAVAFGVFATSAVSADEVADFYRGKTIDLILSTGVGGSNETTIWRNGGDGFELLATRAIDPGALIPGGIPTRCPT